MLRTYPELKNLVYSFATENFILIFRLACIFNFVFTLRKISSTFENCCIFWLTQFIRMRKAHYLFMSKN